MITTLPKVSAKVRAQVAACPNRALADKATAILDRLDREGPSPALMADAKALSQTDAMTP